MKKLVNGEAGTRSVVISTSDKKDEESGIAQKQAVVTHCWKKDRDATRYELVFTYLFDVSEREVYRLAALWLNKDFQNRMRVEAYNEKELAAIEKTVISVKEMYAKRDRKERDPKKAAATAISKMSKDDVLAMFEKYQKDNK